MGHWNLRIMHMTHRNGEEEYFAAEVHYTDDHIPRAYGSAGVRGDTLEEIDQYIQWLKDARARPVLRVDPVTQNILPD